MNQLFPATLPSRVLAALIDYLILSGLYIATSRIFSASGVDEYLSFFCALFYFTLSGSRFAHGQSIGKSLLGLRVLRCTTQDIEESYLSSISSLLRFLTNIGLVIVLAELPPALYRSQETIAETWILELHMLLAFAWLFANIAHVLFHPKHRGLHDLLAHSIVARSEASSIQTQAFSSEKNARKAAVYGALAAFLPWSCGISQTPPVSNILSLRYPIESQFKIRILNAHEQSGEVLIEALTLNSDPLRSKEGQKQFFERLLNLLRSKSAQGSPPQVRLRLYADPSMEPMTPSGGPLEISSQSVNLVPSL